MNSTNMTLSSWVSLLPLPPSSSISTICEVVREDPTSIDDVGLRFNTTYCDSDIVPKTFSSAKKKSSGESDDNNALSLGSIVGIAVGVAIGVVLLAGLIYVFAIRRGVMRKNSPSENLL
jgi:hypothetical protein